jgi:hypothetical protein
MTIVSKAAEYDPADPDSSFLINNGTERGQVEVGREDGKAYVVVNDQHTFQSDDVVQAVDLAFAILKASGATQEDVAALVSGLPREDENSGLDVHLISCGEYDDYRVNAVASTQELAADIVRQANELLSADVLGKYQDSWQVSTVVPYFDAVPHLELRRVDGRPEVWVTRVDPSSAAKD